MDKPKQIIRRFFGIGKHIKIFALLHAGERGTHHISGVIPAPAPGDDALAERFFYQCANLGFGKVVELDALAGSEMHQGDLVFFYAVCNKLQLPFGNFPSGEAQAQHAGVAAPLGIASKPAGKFLIFGDVHFFLVKFFGHFVEFL